jgi:hypothetical protein
MQLRYKVSGELDDLCFLRIEVKNQISVSEDVTVAHFCGSIGSLEKGQSFEITSIIRHLTPLAPHRSPLHPPFRQANVSVSLLNIAD